MFRVKKEIWNSENFWCNCFIYLNEIIFVSVTVCQVYNSEVLIKKMSFLQIYLILCLLLRIHDMQKNIKWSIHLLGYIFGPDSKESTYQSKRLRFNPWVRKTPGEGNGQPLQYSCLGEFMDRGAWQAAVYEVTKM